MMLAIVEPCYLFLHIKVITFTIQVKTHCFIVKTRVSNIVNFARPATATAGNNSNKCTNQKQCLITEEIYHNS